MLHFKSGQRGAVRRKVNGRVTGWNPPHFARERRAGSSMRKIFAKSHFSFALRCKAAFFICLAFTRQIGDNPLRGFPRAPFRVRGAQGASPGRPRCARTLAIVAPAARSCCRARWARPSYNISPRPAVCKTRYSTAPKVPRRFRFCGIPLGTHPSPRGEGSRRSPQGERPGDGVEPPLPSRGRGGRG